MDNYDSFVHNLARYVRNLGHATEVIRSDQIDVDGCRELNPRAIILSPGPHRPEQAGCSIDVIRQLGAEVPILGICLGHQAIGAAFESNIVGCGPLHGSASPIHHHGVELFAGCEDPMNVGRYHSLAISRKGFSEQLEITAWADDGTIMGVRHRERPIFGLQFHPESVLTPDGSRTLSNFLAIARGENAIA